MRPSTARGKPEAVHRSKNDASDFFQAGLSNMSDDLENKMRSELKNSSEQLKSEVAEILEERQKKTDAKMDAIFQKLQYLSMSMASESVKRSASPVRGEKTFDQAEANRKLVMRRDEQIGQITEQLQVVSEQLEKVQKKSEMDDMARSLSAAMDLPSVMDVQMMGFFQKFKDMQQEQKAQATDVALTLEQVKQRLDEAVKVDFTPVMREVSRCQSMMGEDFQHLVAEIARIQQGLHLDYAQLSKSNMEPVPSPEMSPHETVDSNKVEEKITATPQVEQSKSESKRGTAYSRLKRVREFWSQTENDTTDTWIQTDPDMQKKEKRKTGIIPRKNPKGNLRKANNTLADADAMKEKARKALMQPQYDVFDYYHEEGFFQAIAKHPWFDNVTIFLVCMNAIWIAIEIDNNTASFLLDADLFFIIVENAFCGYFFLEVCVRFGAFARKASALRDFWFVFDFVLVGNMVLETWLLPIIMVSFNITSANFGMDLSVLRMLRMVKLLRLSRIARILRSIPELVIIVKAIGFAARSVAVFLLLWLVIIYLFAVVMTQLTGSIANTPGSQKFFPDVPTAMSSLLLDGILADYAPFIHDMENPLLWLLLLCFVLLSSVTIMYMLVGVLVEVVGVIAAAEKEGIIVSHVASKLRQKMIDMGYNPDDPAISKFQMQSILLEPDIAQMLTMSNVDVVVLMDSLEMLYEDLAKQGGSVTFEKMVDLVLNGRGANVATVRDTKELLRIIKAVVKASTTEIEKKLSEEFGHITAGLNLLREEALARDENPDEEGEDEGDADADPDADLDADAEEEDMQGGPKTR